MSVTTSRVGSDLRASRERLGYTLPAIAAHLRIRLPFLEAIEDGRISDLPGNAYAVGFLRTYAQALGLDPDEVARRFKAEAAEVNRKTELDFPAPVPERGIPAGALVLLGAVIVIGAYIGWYRMSGRPSSEAENVPPVPARLAALSSNASPSAPAPSVAASAPPASGVPAGSPPPSPGPNLAMLPRMMTPPPAIAPPTAAPSAQAGAAPGTPAPQAPPSVAPPSVAPPSVAPPPVAPPSAAPPAGVALVRPNAAAANSAPASTPASVGVPAPVPAPAPVSTAPVSIADAGRMVLRAKAESWVQVRDKVGGTVLLNRVLRPGETWPVPAAKSPLLMTTGNAAGTELLVDGVVTASLGGDGAVRRDLPLDPEMARDGKLAPGVTSLAAKPPPPPVTKTN